MKQSSFTNLTKQKLSFGGSLINKTTNPKVARPLSAKLPIHLLLRANRSWMRLPRSFKLVNDTVVGVAKRRGVRIYEFANVGNHLHVLIRIPNRGQWAAFIRELTGRLATIEGRSDVWAARPFTRLVNGWQKAYRSVREYVRLNAWEAEAGLSRAESTALRDLEKIWRETRPNHRTA